MEKYKTVKEVCELTGLNRKLLHIYDKEGIVKPSSHKNIGYEGVSKKTGVKVDYTGYKLYDDEAVMKLQQIAIYEKLGTKRSVIRELFSSKRSNVDLLNEQIELLKKERKKIDELLIVAEQLKTMGMKGELAKYYASTDFSEVAHNVMQWQESKSMKIFDEVFKKSTNEFEVEADKVLDDLLALADDECESEKAKKNVEELLVVTRKYYGFVGWLIIVSMATCAMGEGDAVAELVAECGDKQVKNAAKAVLSYLEIDMNVLWDEYIEILAKYFEAIGKDYKNSKVKKLVEEVKRILHSHMGLDTLNEYEIVFELLRMHGWMKKDDYLGFTLRAMEYYHNQCITDNNPNVMA